MNKANKINPIDIILVRILMYTKVMKQLKIENEELKMRQNKKRASHLNSPSLLNSASTYSPTQGQYHRR